MQFSFFWRAWVSLLGHSYPRFGLLVMSTLGFKARVDFVTCMLCDLCLMDSSLVWHLHRSWAILIYILTYKHWWGLSLGSNMPLPQSIWQDRCPTKWTMPARIKMNLCFKKLVKRKEIVTISTELLVCVGVCVGLHKMQHLLVGGSTPRNIH